jgi:hypothetical protein
MYTRVLIGSFENLHLIGYLRQTEFLLLPLTDMYHFVIGPLLVFDAQAWPPFALNMTHQHYDFENLSISDFSAQDLLQIFVSMVTLSTVDPEMNKTHSILLININKKLTLINCFIINTTVSIIELSPFIMLGNG